MIDHQRGFTLVEVLVASLLTTIVAAGLFSAYLATARSFRQSSVQAALQRQGALALEDISRQVRGARDSNDHTPDAITVGMCNGHADSVRVNTPSGTTICYYATPDGALCEFRGVACRNLLAGGLESIVLVKQPASPDPRCPAMVPSGSPCFFMDLVPDPQYRKRQVNIAFAIRDNDGDLDGVNTISFRTTLTGQR